MSGRQQYKLQRNEKMVDALLEALEKRVLSDDVLDDALEKGLNFIDVFDAAFNDESFAEDVVGIVAEHIDSAEIDADFRDAIEEKEYFAEKERRDLEATNKSLMYI